ncbi:hypothetical protein ES703_99538 [subsurface metagenome]
MCPTQNDSSGSLKYPDIDKDKTEVLKKQVDGLVVNAKGLTCALFCLQ